METLKLSADKVAWMKVGTEPLIQLLPLVRSQHAAGGKDLAKGCGPANFWQV